MFELSAVESIQENKPEDRETGMQEGCVKELAWHTCSHSSSSDGGGSYCSDISSTHSLIGSGMITHAMYICNDHILSIRSTASESETSALITPGGNILSSHQTQLQLCKLV